MTKVLIDGVLLAATCFFVGCDIGDGDGWSGVVLLQMLIGVVLIGLLLGDLGLLNGL